MASNSSIKLGITAACVALLLSACGGSPGGGEGATGLTGGGVVIPTAGTYLVSTLAGTGTQGYSDGAGSNAMFAYPSAVAVDTSGNVLVADTSNDLLRKISVSGTVSSLAGQAGVQGFQEGSGAQAQFNHLVGLVTDSQGNTFVADTENNRIRKVSPTGEVSTYAGSGDFNTVDGPAAQASFGNPQGLAFDKAGNLYVADTGLSKIRKISTSGEVSTVAGDGQEGFADCNLGSCARFFQPQAIALDSKGNLYITDARNQRIRKITPAGAVTTFAGTGYVGYADGQAEASMFNSPMGIAVDSKDNVYVADQNNRVIRKITPAGEVSTVAGKPGYVGNSNGLGSQATFYLPSGLAIDKEDNLYVADYSNHSVRKLSLK